MSAQLERIESQLRWLHYSRLAVKMLKVMPKQEIVKNFDDIRIMKRYELREFIRNNQRACEKIKSRRYTPMDAYIASKVVYAQNRLILM
jgi:hypothetical protein